jgi:hypothetical protein
MRLARAGKASAQPVSRFEIEEKIGLIAPTLRDSTQRALLDSVAAAAEAAITEREIRTRIWAPVRSREAALSFWRQSRFSTLNIGAVSFDNNGAAFSELAAPFLHAVRVSINAVVAAGGGDKTTDDGTTSGTGGEGQTGDEAPAGADPPTVGRFVNGGGTLNVAFAFPLAHVGFPRDAFDAMVLFAPRVGGTPKALGANTRDETLLIDSGVEFHVKSTDLTDGVGVFFQTRYAFAGGSGEFGDLVGLKGRHDSFDYLTASVGMILGGKYLVTASRVLEGPRTLRDLKWQVGITAMKSADK